MTRTPKHHRVINLSSCEQAHETTDGGHLCLNIFYTLAFKFTAVLTRPFCSSLVLRWKMFENMTSRWPGCIVMPLNRNMSSSKLTCVLPISLMVAVDTILKEMNYFYLSEARWEISMCHFWAGVSAVTFLSHNDKSVKFF